MPLVALDQVSIAYGHLPLLDGATLQVDPGERIALIGRNGTGKSTLLQIVEGSTAKQRKLDLSPILSTAGLADDKPQYCTDPHNAPFDKGAMAERMLADMRQAIDHKSGGTFGYEVANFHRSIGARLSGEIARLWGNYGMAHSPLIVRLRGSVGQSFGVWNAGGLYLYL